MQSHKKGISKKGKCTGINEVNSKDNKNLGIKEQDPDKVPDNDSEEVIISAYNSDEVKQEPEVETIKINVITNDQEDDNEDRNVGDTSPETITQKPMTSDLLQTLWDSELIDLSHEEDEQDSDIHMESQDVVKEITDTKTLESLDNFTARNNPVVEDDLKTEEDGEASSAMTQEPGKLAGGEHLEENHRVTGPVNSRIVSVLQGAAPGLVIRSKRRKVGH